MESKNLGSDSKIIEVDDTVEKNKEELKEKNGDELPQCHHHSSDSDSNSKSGSGSDSNDSSKSGSTKGYNEEKSKEKALLKKKHKRRALKGKLKEKASEAKDEGAPVNSDEANKLECHSDSSTSSKSSSKSASSSKSSVSSKSVPSSKSNSDSGSKSGSDSGGKKTKLKKKGLKQKAKETSFPAEEGKLPEKKKLTDAEEEIEAKRAEKTENTTTSKEESKGISETTKDDLPVNGKNAVEKTSETSTEGN